MTLYTAGHQVQVVRIMKVKLLTTLTLIFCLTLPQCYATQKEEFLEVLRELAHEADDEYSLKPIPTEPEDPTKRHLDPEACGESAARKTAARGTIDFPHGNEKYSRLASCGWAIVGKSGSTVSSVSITFTFINIEEDDPCDDYIQIYSLRASGRKYAPTPLTKKLCPDRIQDMRKKTFTTTEDGLYIDFESDWWDNRRGFTLNWEINYAGSGGGGSIGGGNGVGGGGSSGGGSGGGAVVPGGSNDVSNLNCDFDRGMMCGWSSVSSDSLTWEAKMGSKSPWRSWGKEDHTTGKGRGYYAYLYTNDGYRGSKGGLTSPVLSAGPHTGRCLTFYYNMLQTDGVFKVIMKYNDGRTQTVLQRDGSQGNAWLKATVSLLSKRPFSIIFEHARGGLDVETGLAIDDVTVTNQQCPSRLNSCGTNIYGSRKKRDLRSLLKALLEEEKKEKKEAKKEQKEDLKTEKKEEEKLEERIIGGTPSRKGEFPWIVHIRIFSSGVESGRYSQCGGSIIDDEWILTAAHCFESNGATTTDPEKVRVYLGEHNTHYGEVEESQFVLVPEKVIIHPDRNANALIGMRPHQNDLTLLKLKYKLTFTDSVNAVCLPDSMIDAGTRCVAAGWGLAESGDTSTRLLHLNKVIQSDRSCTYSITEDMICAIAPSGVSDVCRGDSGGPLVCKRSKQYELAGAVSFGDACANRKRSSGVYADIYYFMPWIKSTID